MRGVARREGAWPGFRQTGPVFHGRARNAGTLDAHNACVRVFPARHAASFRFRVHGQSDRPAVFVPRGGFPSAARGRDVCGVTLAGAASRPTAMTPHESAPQVDGTLLTYASFTRSQ